jgi:hypothetical protein
MKAVRNVKKEKELIYGYLDLTSDKSYYFGQSDTNLEICDEQVG